MTVQVKPESIRLETTTVCQLKCPACDTAMGKTRERLGAGFLKLEDFKRVVDDNPWIFHIELSNWGELFLNPDLPKIMEYAYQKNVALTATNGANLNTVKESVLEDLVKYKFRHITCSIDGASQETYSLYRVGGNFDRVIENLRIINRYKSAYNSEFPLLTWQFIVFGHNEHEISAAREMARSMNIEFYPKLSWDENISPVKDEALVRQATKSGAASRSDYLDQYGEAYMQKDICKQLWRLPQINWDGKILGCCYNNWGDFGNAFDAETVGNGLNNDKISYARQMLLGQVDARADIPCTTCKYYKRMQETDNWLAPNDLNHLICPKREKFLSLLGRWGVWLVNRSKLAARMYVKYYSYQYNQL